MEISWTRTISSQCQYKEENSTIICGSEHNNITIDGLDEYTTYFIQVCVRSCNVSDAINVMTEESGNTIILYKTAHNVMLLVHNMYTCSSISYSN